MDSGITSALIGAAVALLGSGFGVAVRYRNRYVHRNQPSGAAEDLAAFLDGYFIGVVEMLLGTRVRFESHARLIDTLDLTPDTKVLRQQIVDRRRALKIRDLK